MKVYLINPPSDFLLDDKSNVPLGLLYIHAYLKKNDVDVTIVDLAGKKPEEWNIPLDGDFYGVTATTPQFEDAQIIADMVKIPTNYVVLGGVHGTVATEESLRDSEFDAVVRHEGEETMLEVVTPLTNMYDVLGLSFKGLGNRVVHNPPRPFEKDIDKFPHPHGDAIDMSTYSRGVFTTSDGDVIKGTQIITSRGCPHDCAFCCSPLIYNRRVRYHSVEYMREWIEDLNTRGYNNFYVVDDTLLLNKKRLAAICALFKEKGSTWRACVRGDACTEEKLQQLYDAGCRQVDIGVESGSQKVLDIVKKGEKVEDNGNAIEYAHKVGIKVKSCLIVGLPGEEQEDVDLTKEFIRTHKPDSATLCTFIPYPGTDIYKNAHAYGYTIDPDTPYSQYVLCGADIMAKPVSTKERNKKILDFRQQLLDVISEVSQTTNQVLRKRKES